MKNLCFYLIEKKNQAVLFFSRLILFFIFLGAFSNANAVHLAGGDVTYTWWKGNYFILKFTIFRDCSGIAPTLPSNINYKIFEGSSPSTAYMTNTASRVSISSISPANPHCNTYSGYCFQRGIYIDTVQLGIDTVGYHVVYFDGNLNSSILNINVGSPSSVGEVWYAFMPPVKYHNSSPQFIVSPLPVQCAGYRNSLNLNISDPDKNDSLVYSLPAPYKGPNSSTSPSLVAPPYKTLSYNSGYSVYYPFGTLCGPIKIDSNGIISDSSCSSGKYYITVQVDDYKYDSLLKKRIHMSAVRRDFEIIISNCPASSNHPPTFDKDSLGLTRNITADSMVCINVAGRDSDRNDTTYMWVSAASLPSGASFPSDTSWSGKYSGYSRVHTQSSLCWKPSCADVSSMPYKITINLVDNACHLTQETYTINVNSPKAKFSANRVCLGNATVFTDLSPAHTRQIWYFGDGDTSSAKSPVHNYKNGGVFNASLKIFTGTGCSDSGSQKVMVDSFCPMILKGRISTSVGAALKHSKVYLCTYDALDTIVNVKDSVTTDTLGNYSFIPKDSLVYLFVLPELSSYPHELPLWADSGMYFVNGNAIKLHSGITVKNLKTSYGANPGGSGFIGGKISFCRLCKTFGSGAPVARLRLILADSSGKAQAYTYTNASGDFSFSNLASGSYRILADRPLLDNKISPVVKLTPLDMVQDKLGFTLYQTLLQLDVTNGIEQAVLRDKNISIFPNPATGFVTIKADISGGIISINDMTGRVVLRVEFNKYAETDLHAFPKGVYFVIISGKNTMFTQKLIIQ